MARYLLDTNHLSATLDDEAGVRERMLQFRQGGHRLGTCVPAEIYHDLRARGRVLSQVDMMLSALSRSLDATLLTDDRDFEALPDLRIENWLH